VLDRLVDYLQGVIAHFTPLFGAFKLNSLTQGLEEPPKVAVATDKKGGSEKKKLEADEDSRPHYVLVLDDIIANLPVEACFDFKDASSVSRDLCLSMLIRRIRSSAAAFNPPADESAKVETPEAFILSAKDVGCTAALYFNN
jgi:hypothetical protein